MGNNQGSQPPSAGDVRGTAPSSLSRRYDGHEDPIESIRQEKQRADHLRNLDFKRSKSIRRSIAKRLKKRGSAAHSDEAGDVTDAPIPECKRPERLKRGDLSRDKPLVGQPQPLPAHVQDSLGGEESASRKMDRLRKSFRSSIRKKKEHPTSETNNSSTTSSSGNSKKQLWQSDEVAVRAGTCCFQVKYLGSVEVFESRGMQVCEEAIKVLKHSKRSVRSVLHVSGDGLRVVDDETKGLIVDQTIEKVSFCAPDRNYNRGFSYICRDGTTRRWMCNGFIAVKETGERLSHAVGCAFAICLERKQKRDKECAVSVNFDSSSSSFTRLGSFRHASITERLQDPQILKPGPEELPVVKEKVVNPYAIARPHTTDLMLQRQTSFRGFGQLNSSGNSPFKRQLSLRLTELPSTMARQKSNLQINNETNSSSKARGPSNRSPLPSAAVVNNECVKEGSSSLAANNNEDPKQKIMAAYNLPWPSVPYTTSPLPTVPENQPLSSVDEFGAIPAGRISHSSPVSNASSASTVQIQPHLSPSHAEPASNEVSSVAATRQQQSPVPVKKRTEEKNSSTKLLFDNPWDLVPDQPSFSGVASSLMPAAATKALNGGGNYDSSSGVSSSSSFVANAPWQPQQRTILTRDGAAGGDALSTSSDLCFGTSLHHNGDSAKVNGDCGDVGRLFDSMEVNPNAISAGVLGVESDSNKKKNVNELDFSVHGEALSSGGNDFSNIFSSVSLNISEERNEGHVMECSSPSSDNWKNSSAVILDDPFDAEWAALASRSERDAAGNALNKINTNPFKSHNKDILMTTQASGTPVDGMRTAFELQM